MRQLRKRTQFLNAARGNRFAGRFFVLQSRRVAQTEPGIGYTVTRRTGNSPERSRIRRRLRAAVFACQSQFKEQHDYVLIGRRAALGAPFSTLVEKLTCALAYLHKQETAG
ncbi:MAG TPA: ribonuclease P protein component [Devosia sp.]|nr:ribonuclease P protein component [Devosia sp.]